MLHTTDNNVSQQKETINLVLTEGQQSPFLQAQTYRSFIILLFHVQNGIIIVYTCTAILSKNRLFG